MTVLLLRGARHYEAGRAYGAGRLRPGASLRVKWDSQNIHDPNAVVVFLASSGEKLGYISRKIAPKYKDALRARAITSAQIAKIRKGRHGSADLLIYVRLGMTRSGDKSSGGGVEELQPGLGLVIGALPTDGGVYEIENSQTGRRYIGSSASIRRRVRQHFSDASIGAHHSALFQSDFRAQEGKGFVARVLVVAGTAAKRAAEEEAWIKRALLAGRSLYNMTSDGQGRQRWSNATPDAPPISDWSGSKYRHRPSPDRRPATGERPATYTNPKESRPSPMTAPDVSRAEFAALLRNLGQDTRLGADRRPATGETTASHTNPNESRRSPMTPPDVSRAEFAALLRKLGDDTNQRPRSSLWGRLVTWLWP